MRARRKKSYSIKKGVAKNIFSLCPTKSKQISELFSYTENCLQRLGQTRITRGEAEFAYIWAYRLPPIFSITIQHSLPLRWQRMSHFKCGSSHANASGISRCLCTSGAFSTSRAISQLAMLTDSVVSLCVKKIQKSRIGWRQCGKKCLWADGLCGFWLERSQYSGERSGELTLTRKAECFSNFIFKLFYFL